MQANASCFYATIQFLNLARGCLTSLMLSSDRSLSNDNPGDYP
ncbi:hypothetical protein [Thalassoporum mexicanum]|nr:hypothetical protein [Pseudanabaena sp. PCC 7367]